MTFPLPIVLPFRTYPVIEATATGGSYSTQSSCAVPLPTGIVSGDRLLTFLALVRGGITSIILDSGWSNISSNSVGNLQSARIFERIANGTEGATVTHTFSAASRWAAVTLRITDSVSRENHSTGATGSTANPNPPNRAWASGSRDTLILAAGFVDFNNTTNVWTNDPNGYIEVATARPDSSGNAYASVRVAQRQLPAISAEDPGEFSITTSRSWAAKTVLLSRYA